jgi:hypothetical protein
MGDGIRVDPGETIEQRQLQSLDIGKMIQPFFQETLAKPLPVAFMNRHFITSRIGMVLAFPAPMK